jgi:enterochelin esterase-like enzyme
MKSTCRALLALGLTIALCAMFASSLLAQTPGAATPKGTVERIKVHGKSLEGNLEGDSPDRDVFVYLPPGYSTNASQRYPVVYMLHGYGLTAERWMPFTRMADAADKNIAAGAMREMILVNPDAFTLYNGSMYSTSSTIGDWETFIAEDLVSYIDSHYRTIPDRLSRGLGGHSMGGYGTVRIGMKRPDVFSSMYIMSACCLMNNPGAGGNRGAGARGTEGTAAAGGRGAQDAATPATTPSPQANPNQATGNAAPAGTRGEGGQPAQPPAQAGQRGQDGQGGQGRGGRGGRGGFGNTQAAQAAAWSSNPNNPPTFYDLPTVDGQPQPAIAAKWVANSPLVMVDQYLTSLKKYKAIMIEVGTQDGLAAANRQLDESFKKFGIAHTFETYEGDHTNRVPVRIEEKVLPFFSKNLSFAAPR